VRQIRQRHWPFRHQQIARIFPPRDGRDDQPRLFHQRHGGRHVLETMHGEINALIEQRLFQAPW